MTDRRRRVIRLGVLLALVIALVVIGAQSGLRARFTVENIRAMAVASGVWGMLGFCAAYCIGGLLYLPGLVFLVAAVLAWGELLGAGIAYVAALLTVVVSFVLVRSAGGNLLGESPRPLVRRVLSTLDAHPIRAVFILRLVFWSSPPLNYALALTSLSFRNHLIGSALGLVLPVVGVALFTDWALRMLS